jgi:hypothetical protein
VIDASLNQQVTSPIAGKRRPLGRQPNDHNFGSLIMLAVTAGSFLLVARVATKGLFFVIQESPIR